MIRIENEVFGEDEVKKSDLFVTCVGYEKRSFYVIDKIYERGSKNIVVFTIDDYESFECDVVNKINKYKEEEILQVVKYSDAEIVQKCICEKVKEIKQKKEVIRVDVDYSSMPRGWYCRLPELLSKIVNENDKIFFWYSEGSYSSSADNFHSAGIESYMTYSGRSSFDLNRSRIHLIGVGYDCIRTQGIVSILDPEKYITCEAYDPNREEIHKEVIRVNASVIEQTPWNLTLYITDMKYMIAKLLSIVNEFVYGANSDIILVPDGPKPLIFAMSMMPWLANVEKGGITCIHILRNEADFIKENVMPVGKVIGFSIQK